MPVQYAEELLAKTFEWKFIHKEQDINQIFSQGTRKVYKAKHGRILVNTETSQPSRFDLSSNLNSEATWRMLKETNFEHY